MATTHVYAAGCALLHAQLGSREQVVHRPSIAEVGLGARPGQGAHGALGGGQIDLEPVLASLGCEDPARCTIMGIPEGRGRHRTWICVTNPIDWPCLMGSIRVMKNQQVKSIKIRASLGMIYKSN